MGFNAMFTWLPLHNKYLRRKRNLVEMVCTSDDKIAINIHRYWEIFNSDKLSNEDIQLLIEQTRLLVNVCK